MPNLLTLDEVSQRTRVPLATLRYWRYVGIGPRTFRLGRRVMAYEADIDSWVAGEAAKDLSARSTNR